MKTQIFYLILNLFNIKFDSFVSNIHDMYKHIICKIIKCYLLIAYALSQSDEKNLRNIDPRSTR